MDCLAYKTIITAIIIIIITLSAVASRLAIVRRRDGPDNPDSQCASYSEGGSLGSLWATLGCTISTTGGNLGWLVVLFLK